MAANLRAICETLGIEADDATIERALAAREAMYRAGFHPREGALETLTELRSRGYPIALVSMCAADTPERWRALPLAPFVEVTVFSCETGLRKPDPAIYLAATDRLGVDARRACLRRRRLRRAHRRRRGRDDPGPDPRSRRSITTAADARGRRVGGAVIGDLRELLGVLLPAR